MSTQHAARPGGPRPGERSTTGTRRRRRRLVTFAIGGAAALTLGLGACSGGADSAAPAASSGTSASASSGTATTQKTAFEVVKSSSERSKEAGSGKFSLTTSGTVQGTAVDLSGEGSFDSATSAFEMTMTLPAEAGGTTVTIRVVDGVMYLSGAPLTGEGQWVKMSLDGLPGMNAQSMDPSAALDQLQAVADDVKEVPGVTVRGVQTTGYSGTIDPAAAAATLPESERPSAADLQALGPIPFTLYVDSDERPARVVVEQSGVTVTMDYYDWGSEVDDAAPDPSTVTDMSGMPGMQGAEGSTGTATTAAAA